MTVEREPSSGNQIDDVVVKRYFDGAGGTSAAAMSVMSHEHNLPPSSVGYRLIREMDTIVQLGKGVSVNPRSAANPSIPG